MPKGKLNTKIHQGLRSEILQLQMEYDVSESTLYKIVKKYPSLSFWDIEEVLMEKERFEFKSSLSFLISLQIKVCEGHREAGSQAWYFIYRDIEAGYREKEVISKLLELLDSALFINYYDEIEEKGIMGCKTESDDDEDEYE